MTLRLTMLACLAAAAALVAGCAALRSAGSNMYPYTGPIMVGTNAAPAPHW